MMKRWMTGLAAFGLTLGPALAAETDDLMAVQVTIVAGCSSISAPTLNMGVLSQGGAGEALGDIVVTCGNGVAYNVAVEGGENDAAGSRRMTDSFDDGTQFIPYTIVSGNCASVTEVGTNMADPAFNYTPRTAYPAGNVLTGTGSGGAQNLSICAKVTAAATQNALARTYTDTVRVVVAF